MELDLDDIEKKHIALLDTPNAFEDMYVEFEHEDGSHFHIYEAIILMEYLEGEPSYVVILTLNHEIFTYERNELEFLKGGKITNEDSDGEDDTPIEVMLIK